MRRLERGVWGLAFLAALLLATTPVKAIIRPDFDDTSNGGTPGAGTVTLASFAAFDAGPFTFPGSGGVATMDADSIALGTKTTGNYVESITFGAGLSGTAASEGSTPTAATDSTEASFLASGALTCGASTQGKMKVHTTALQYCDNAATPTLQYAAYGASDGSAKTGDSATAFFSAGTLETAIGGLGADGSAQSGVPTFTAGTVGWRFWQGGGKVVCGPGTEAAAICKTFTNLAANPTVTSAGNNQFIAEDLNVVTQMMVFARLSVAPSAGSSVQIQCDNDITFGSPTTCASITGIAASNGNKVGSWTTLSGTDCTTATTYCRGAMGDGDGAADPVAILIGYALH